MHGFVFEYCRDEGAREVDSIPVEIDLTLRVVSL